MFLIKLFVDLEGYRFILDIRTDLKQIIERGLCNATSQLHCYSLYSFYKCNLKGFSFEDDTTYQTKLSKIHQSLEEIQYMSLFTCKDC